MWNSKFVDYSTPQQGQPERNVCSLCYFIVAVGGVVIHAKRSALLEHVVVT